VAAAAEEILRLEIADRFVAHAGSGTVWVVVDGPRAAAAFARLATIGAGHRGHAVLTDAAPEVKRGLDVWGPPPPALPIMTEIKRRFDPHALLNPGRFIAFL
jgi:FAD/FMN-containing dehydrogenase